MKISHLYTEFNHQLQNVYDSREAANISDLVFERVTGLKRWERNLLRDTDEKNYISENQFHETSFILENLLKNKPLQYILHEAWFYKLKFFVDENVLIPRPETEELTDWIIKSVEQNKATLPFQILDIGTGSGCIAVALKHELPDAQVTAVDVSINALKVAGKNASDNRCTIQFQQLDMLNENDWPQLGKYNVIVSNPPYIPFEEKETLHKNVSEHEPPIALFVDNGNPFIFYEKIAEFAKMHLKEEGRVYLEVHENYASNVCSILFDKGFTPNVKKDIYQKERMICAYKTD